MNCPICKKAGLLEDASACPQCNSDLTGLQQVKKAAEAQENLATEKKALAEALAKSEGQNRYARMAAVAFLCTTACSFLWIFMAKKPANQTEITALNTENEPSKIQVNAASNTKKTEPNNAQNIFKYKVKKGDNLIKIARLFYGNGSLYSEIIKDNQLAENSTLLVGDTLIIKPKN